MAIPQNIEELAHKVRTEIYGRDVREALATSMEATAEVAEWSREVAQQIIDGSFDEGELNTEIERKLNELEEQYAPKLTNLETEIEDARGSEPSLGGRLDNFSTQLAQSEQQVNKLRNDKADKTYVNNELNVLQSNIDNKVDKNGNEQITWAMAAQDFREQITGGNTAVVGIDSVNTSNLVDGSVTSKKRTFIGEVGILGNNSSGEVVDFNFEQNKVIIPDRATVLIRNRRYYLNAGEVNMLSGGSSGLYFNTETNTFTITEFNLANEKGYGDSLTNINEYAILVAMIYPNTQTVSTPSTQFKVNGVHIKDSSFVGQMGVVGGNSEGDFINFDFVNGLIKVPEGITVSTRGRRYYVEATEIPFINQGTTGLFFETKDATFYLTNYDFAENGDYGNNVVPVSDTSVLIGTLYPSIQKVSIIGDQYRVNDSLPVEHVAEGISRNGGSITITGSGQIQAESAYNPDWEGWDDLVYGFGDFHKKRMFNEFKGVLATDSHIFVRGGEGRWGFHVFEGYGKENDKRLTMLAGKYTETSAIYYYKPGQNFYWVQVGSDNIHRGFYFSQHKAEFYEDVEFMDSEKGVVLQSPNGSKFKLQVDDNGNLSTSPYTPEGRTTKDITLMP